MTEPEGHVFQRAGDCCIWCGVKRIDVAVPRILPPDKRAICPGGPGSNVHGITHLIAARRVAAALHWDRPYRPPVA